MPSIYSDGSILDACQGEAWLGKRLLKKHPGEDLEAELEAEAGREVIPCNSKLKENSQACNNELKFTAYKSSQVETPSWIGGGWWG